MTSEEKKIAREMFETTYNNIEDAKDRIVKELEKASTLDSEIKRFGLQSL